MTQRQRRQERRESQSQKGQSERRILLLGAPRIERDRAMIQIERRKAVAVLAYLVLTRQFVSREELAAMFWPDATTTRALAYLRTTLWTLNTALGDDWCVVDGGSVAFNAQSGITDDVSQFQALAESDDLEAMTRAVDLWRGGFMHGFSLGDSAAFEEWQFFRAEALRDQLASTLRRLIDRLMNESDYERALGYARRWLSLDPLDESAHRALMTLYAQTGQRSAALRQYQEAVRALDEGLGVAPEPETVALYDAIRDGRLGQPERVTAAAEMGMRQAQEMMFSPPVATVSSVEIPIQLPAQTTPFLGRETELAEIGQLLTNPECRLLTLAGPGGIGKTRLAIEAARLCESRPPDGIYFVSLAPLRSPEFLAQTISYAVNCSDDSGGEGRAELLAYLRDKRLLLVVDNFEHLLAGADLLSDILGAAPGVRMLATSRERLQLQEEWVYELRGLDYPPSVAVEGYETFSAVELFVQGARRVRPHFTLTPEDAAAVVEVCRLVEGMPLGIELAATWIQMLTCREIADNLQHNIDFLSTDLRNIPQRHRNLRAVLEYSWQSLSFDEQACLSRLSVFCGGFSLESARDVSGASLQLLRTLVSKSLVRREDASTNGATGLGGRYTMHELLRQFAEQKLPQDENDKLHDLHSDYFMNYLAALLPSLKNADQPTALDAIQHEWDDIVGAWERAIQNQRWDLIEGAFEAFFHFAYVRRRIVDVGDLLAKATRALLAQSRTPTEDMLLVRLLALEAEAVTRTANRQAVVALVDQTVDMLEPYINQPETALTLTELGGLLTYYKRDYVQAESLFDTAMHHTQTINEPWLLGWVYLQFGWFRQNTIRYADARRHFERALEEFRKAGQPSGIARALEALAENHASLGDYDTANRLIAQTIQMYEALNDTLMLLRFNSYSAYFSNSEHNDEMVNKSLQMVREMGDKPSLGWSLYHAAWSKMNYKRRNLDAVDALFAEALPIFEELDDLEGRTWTRVFIAELALMRRDPDTAERLLNEALSILDKQDFPWSRAGSWYVLGNVALMRGDLALAMRFYVDSLVLAREVQSIVQMLRHVLGVIEVLTRQEMGDPVQLYAAVRFINAHQAAANDTRHRAEALLEQLEPGLSFEGRENGLTVSQTLTIDAIVEECLRLAEKQNV